MLQSRGITDLLAAEKEAQALIEEARKRKNKRLKDAQTEAKTEIEHFKGDREQRYKDLEKQVRSARFSHYHRHGRSYFSFSSNSVTDSK